MPTFRIALQAHLARRRSDPDHPVPTGEESADAGVLSSRREPLSYLAETPLETSLIPTGTRSDWDRKENLIDPNPAPIAPAEADQLRRYLDASSAQSTRDGYASDLAHFAAWCADQHLASLPATSATVARYLAALAQAGYKVATLERRLAAISSAHQSAGHDTPTTGVAVRKILAGIKRTHGTARDGKAPLLPDDLRKMIALLDDRPAGLRDRALLLVGFAGAFRRSELMALDAGDVRQVKEGLIITLRQSKTDQEGAGQTRGIPRGRHAETCPVRALQAWLKAAEITDGPLFRPVDKAGRVSDARLADFHLVRLIKRLTEAIGLDPDLYGGHSLRVGLATAAALAGANERDIMRQTGHKSEKMVRHYIRNAELFRDNAADGLL